MLLPGTDPVTMLIEVAPLLVLFELSLILARMVGTPSRATRAVPAGARAAGKPRQLGSRTVLFDLRGKRKRVVQVSYTLLAAIFLVGFVGFWIGVGNAPGGIFDAIGLGGNGSSGSLTAQYDAQIDNANQQLAKNPKDTRCAREAVAERVPEGQGGREPGPDHRSDERQLETPTRRSESRPTPGPSTCASTRESPTPAPPPRSSTPSSSSMTRRALQRPRRSSPPTNRVRTRTATWQSSNTRRVTSRRATRPPRRLSAWHRSRFASRSPSSSTRSTSRL